MKERKKITIKDMAKALNVSTATISNAFNRPDQLSDNLRKKILEGCCKLGYEGPNNAARSLRTGVSGIVGVLLSDDLSYSISDPVASQFLAGLGEVLDRRHCNMLLLSGDEGKSTLKSRQMESMVDGYIVYGGSHPSKLFDRLANQRKPIVAVDVETDQFISVNVENRLGAYRSAVLALKHQPRRVAIIALRLTYPELVKKISFDQGENGERSITYSRWQGYMQAIREYGFDESQVDVIDLPLNMHRHACVAAFMLLEQEHPPELIFCMSDRIALAVLQVALQKGIQVPQDLKIVGFDGIAESQFTFPTLTTVQQFNELKGRKAGEIFLRISPAEDIILPTEILMGDSCPCVD